MDNEITHPKESLPPTLRFKPMSEGLGLNHFADGLPYTPANAKKRPTVQFNFPPPRAPRAAVAPEPAKITETRVDPVSETYPAGFVRRIAAFGLDIFFSTMIFSAIVWFSFRLNGYDVSELLSGTGGSNIFWPLALLYVVMHFGYFLVQETTWRRTLGKAFFGIRIQSSSGFATLGRAVCFFVAVVPLGIGLLWYFFDSRHRCWHDVITDSEVVAS